MQTNEGEKDRIHHIKGNRMEKVLFWDKRSISSALKILFRRSGQ